MVQAMITRWVVLVSLAVCGTVSVSAGQAQDAEKSFYAGKTVRMIVGSGPAGGYAQTRFLAHMEWALVDLPGVEDLIEFETRVNYVVPKYDDAVICAYDLSKFDASVVMDALRTHPVVIIGGLLQENPFFVSPDQFLLEIRERRRSARAR